MALLSTLYYIYKYKYIHNTQAQARSPTRSPTRLHTHYLKIVVDVDETSITVGLIGLEVYTGSIRGCIEFKVIV